MCFTESIYESVYRAIFYQGISRGVTRSFVKLTILHPQYWNNTLPGHEGPGSKTVISILSIFKRNFWANLSNTVFYIFLI